MESIHLSTKVLEGELSGPFFLWNSSSSPWEWGEKTWWLRVLLWWIANDVDLQNNVCLGLSKSFAGVDERQIGSWAIWRGMDWLLIESYHAMHYFFSTFCFQFTSQCYLAWKMTKEYHSSQSFILGQMSMHPILKGIGLDNLETTFRVCQRKS